jgi:hypothetical protein
MSDIGGAGNGAFDAMFFLLQKIGLGLWVLLLPLLWFPRRAWNGLAVGLAVVLVGALPAYWTFRFPRSDGLEGAGRFIFGGPFILANAVCAATFVALLSWRLNEKPWPRLALIGLMIAVSAFLLLL